MMPYNRGMHYVPQVNLADPSVEPTDEELHALMVSVQNDVCARKRKAMAKFRRRLDRAIHGREGARSASTDRYGLAR